MFYTNAIILPKKGLQNLSELLEKATVQISEKNMEESDILSAKLAPDMFDFDLQIKRAIEQAIEVANVFSLKKFETTLDRTQNYSIAELQKFISETIAFLETISENDIVKPENAIYKPFWMPGKKVIGADYLLNFAIPNFYFHIVTAYNILRNLGFNIGKADFLGSNFGSVIREDN